MKKTLLRLDCYSGLENHFKYIFYWALTLESMRKCLAKIKKVVKGVI